MSIFAFTLGYSSQWAIVILPLCYNSRLIINISALLSALKVINEVMKLLNDIKVHTYIRILSLYIQYT